MDEGWSEAEPRRNEARRASAAKDGEDTVLRLYESKNKKGNVTLPLDERFKTCFLCDMMENELEELRIENGKVMLPIGGFEIVTLKVRTR